MYRCRNFDMSDLPQPPHLLIQQNRFQHLNGLRQMYGTDHQMEDFNFNQGMNHQIIRCQRMLLQSQEFYYMYPRPRRSSISNHPSGCRTIAQRRLINNRYDCNGNSNLFVNHFELQNGTMMDDGTCNNGNVQESLPFSEFERMTREHMNQSGPYHEYNNNLYRHVMNERMESSATDQLIDHNSYTRQHLADIYGNNVESVDPRLSYRVERTGNHGNGSHNDHSYSKQTTEDIFYEDENRFTPAYFTNCQGTRSNQRSRAQNEQYNSSKKSQNSKTTKPKTSNQTVSTSTKKTVNSKLVKQSTLLQSALKDVMNDKDTGTGKKGLDKKVAAPCQKGTSELSKVDSAKKSQISNKKCETKFTQSVIVTSSCKTKQVNQVKMTPTRIDHNKQYETECVIVGPRDFNSTTKSAAIQNVPKVTTAACTISENAVGNSTSQRPNDRQQLQFSNSNSTSKTQVITRQCDPRFQKSTCQSQEMTGPNDRQQLQFTNSNNTSKTQVTTRQCDPRLQRCTLQNSTFQSQEMHRPNIHQQSKFTNSNNTIKTQVTTRQCDPRLQKSTLQNSTFQSQEMHRPNIHQQSLFTNSNNTIKTQVTTRQCDPRLQNFKPREHEKILNDNLLHDYRKVDCNGIIQNINPECPLKRRKHSVENNTMKNRDQLTENKYQSEKKTSEGSKFVQVLANIVKVMFNHRKNNDVKNKGLENVESNINDGKNKSSEVVEENPKLKSDDKISKEECPKDRQCLPQLTKSTENDVQKDSFNCDSNKCLKNTNITGDNVSINSNEAKSGQNVSSSADRNIFQCVFQPDMLKNPEKIENVVLDTENAVAFNASSEKPSGHSDTTEHISVNNVNNWEISGQKNMKDCEINSAETLILDNYVDRKNNQDPVLQRNVEQRTSPKIETLEKKDLPLDNVSFSTPFELIDKGENYKRELERLVIATASSDWKTEKCEKNIDEEYHGCNTCKTPSPVKSNDGKTEKCEKNIAEEYHGCNTCMMPSSPKSNDEKTEKCEKNIDEEYHGCNTYKTPSSPKSNDGKSEKCEKNIDEEYHGFNTCKTPSPPKSIDGKTEKCEKNIDEEYHGCNTCKPPSSPKPNDGKTEKCEKNIDGEYHGCNRCKTPSPPKLSPNLDSSSKDFSFLELGYCPIALPLGCHEYDEEMEKDMNNNELLETSFVSDDGLSRNKHMVKLCDDKYNHDNTEILRPWIIRYLDEIPKPTVWKEYLEKMDMENAITIDDCEHQIFEDSIASPELDDENQTEILDILERDAESLNNTPLQDTEYKNDKVLSDQEITCSTREEDLNNNRFEDGFCCQSIDSIMGNALQDNGCLVQSVENLSKMKSVDPQPIETDLDTSDNCKQKQSDTSFAEKICDINLKQIGSTKSTHDDDFLPTNTSGNIDCECSGESTSIINTVLNQNIEQYDGSQKLETTGKNQENIVQVLHCGATKKNKEVIQNDTGKIVKNIDDLMTNGVFESSTSELFENKINLEFNDLGTGSSEKIVSVTTNQQDVSNEVHRKSPEKLKTKPVKHGKKGTSIDKQLLEEAMQFLSNGKSKDEITDTMINCVMKGPILTRGKSNRNVSDGRIFPIATTCTKKRGRPPKLSKVNELKEKQKLILDDLRSEKNKDIFCKQTVAMDIGSSFCEVKETDVPELFYQRSDISEKESDALTGLLSLGLQHFQSAGITSEHKCNNDNRNSGPITVENINGGRLYTVDNLNDGKCDRVAYVGNKEPDTTEIRSVNQDVIVKNLCAFRPDTVENVSDFKHNAVDNVSDGRQLTLGKVIDNRCHMVEDQSDDRPNTVGVNSHFKNDTLENVTNGIQPTLGNITDIGCNTVENVSDIVENKTYCEQFDTVENHDDCRPNTMENVHDDRHEIVKNQTNCENDELENHRDGRNDTVENHDLHNDKPSENHLDLVVITKEQCVENKSAETQTPYDLTVQSLSDDKDCLDSQNVNGNGTSHSNIILTTNQPDNDLQSSSDDIQSSNDDLHSSNDDLQSSTYVSTDAETCNEHITREKFSEWFHPNFDNTFDDSIKELLQEFENTRKDHVQENNTSFISNMLTINSVSTVSNNLSMSSQENQVANESPTENTGCKEREEHDDKNNDQEGNGSSTPDVEKPNQNENSTGKWLIPILERLNIDISKGRIIVTKSSEKLCVRQEDFIHKISPPKTSVKRKNDKLQDSTLSPYITRNKATKSDIKQIDTGTDQSSEEIDFCNHGEESNSVRFKRTMIGKHKSKSTTKRKLLFDEDDEPKEKLPALDDSNAETEVEDWDNSETLSCKNHTRSKFKHTENKEQFDYNVKENFVPKKKGGKLKGKGGLRNIKTSNETDVKAGRKSKVSQKNTKAKRKAQREEQSEHNLKKRREFNEGEPDSSDLEVYKSLEKLITKNSKSKKSKNKIDKDKIGYTTPDQCLSPDTKLSRKGKKKTSSESKNAKQIKSPSSTAKKVPKVKSLKKLSGMKGKQSKKPTGDGKVRFRLVTEPAEQKILKLKADILKKLCTTKACAYCLVRMPYGQYKYHLKVHHPYRCARCGVLFISKEEKGAHRREKHNVERHSCITCEKVFDEKWHYERHVASSGHRHSREIYKRAVNIMKSCLGLETGSASKELMMVTNEYGSSTCNSLVQSGQVENLFSQLDTASFTKHEPEVQKLLVELSNVKSQMMSYVNPCNFSFPFISMPGNVPNFYNFNTFSGQMSQSCYSNSTFYTSEEAEFNNLPMNQFVRNTNDFGVLSENRLPTSSEKYSIPTQQLLAIESDASSSSSTIDLDQPMYQKFIENEAEQPETEMITNTESPSSKGLISEVFNLLENDGYFDCNTLDLNKSIDFSNINIAEQLSEMTDKQLEDLSNDLNNLPENKSTENYSILDISSQPVSRGQDSGTNSDNVRPFNSESTQKQLDLTSPPHCFAANQNSQISTFGNNHSQNTTTLENMQHSVFPFGSGQQQNFGPNVNQPTCIAVSIHPQHFNSDIRQPQNFNTDIQQSQDFNSDTRQLQNFTSENRQPQNFNSNIRQSQNFTSEYRQPPSSNVGQSCQLQSFASVSDQSYNFATGKNHLGSNPGENIVSQNSVTQNQCTQQVQKQVEAEYNAILQDIAQTEADCL